VLETRGRRSRRARRRTVRLAGAAAAASAALASGELILLARREGPRATAVALREGYRRGTANETALLNLFLAFVGSFGAARGVTYLIRAQVGPLRDIHVGSRHIHHFVPGIGLSLLAGAASIVLRHEEADQWLALPFGAGAALVLDEAALLLELEDVYWSEEGVLGVQAGLGTVAVLATLALTVRMLRRGEQAVPAADNA
jgi:hypothetical protein